MPTLIDLYCGAGGAAMGYHNSGYDTIIGIDSKPQPRYPFTFIQADALAWFASADLTGVDAVHASPPCKLHTSMWAFSDLEKHADYIPATRELLTKLEIPWVIENVPGAPLIDPITLCGSMFNDRGMWIRRHRLFESNWEIGQPACQHALQASLSPGFTILEYHSGQPVPRQTPVVSVFGRGQGMGKGEVDIWRKVMGIDWMNQDELAQAIPPAYTEHIGYYLQR